MFRTADFMASSRNWPYHVLAHSVSPYRYRNAKNTDSAFERWLRRFRHHYNHDRPNQALGNQTPVEAVLN